MTMAESHIPATDHGVGRRLKQCREERKLSIQDVSAQMRLEPRIIEALESDDYERLPAPLYVRGYLRGYAKVLKIDPASLLSQYESGADPETPEIVPEVKHPTQTSSSDKPVKLFTYLVSLTLVVLLVTWWQSKFVVGSGSSEVSASMAQPQSPQTGLGYPINVVRHPDVPSYRAPEPAQAPAQPGPDADSSNAAGTAATPSTVDAPALASESSGTDSPPPPEPAQNVTVAGPDGPDHIVIRVTADSWIEVFDANETKIYRNLARAGDVLKLSGTAPFSVLLGFAQGINLTFNGKPFDPAPYSRSGVARFTLHH